MKIIKGAIAGLLVVTVSCVAPAKKTAPPESLEVPAKWQAASGQERETNTIWWEAFSSPELDQLLGEAFSGNPDLQAMTARVESAAASARIAGASLYPGVTAGLDGSRRKQNFIGFPIPGSTSNVLSTQATTYGLSLATNWELDLWGRVRASKRAAMAEQGAANADYGMRRLSLAAQVSKGWLNVIAARQQLSLAERSAASFADTADKIRSRYEQGLRSTLEYQLSINSAESAKALVVERRQQVLQAVQQLELLLGRYPAGALETDEELPELIGDIAAGIPSTLMTRRPDLVAAERRLAAADQRLRESKASLFPQISLSGSTGTSTAELKDLLDTDFSVWTLAGNLAQPLFQGGRLRAGVDLSKGRVKEALAQYVSAVLKAFGEVEYSLASEAFLKEREGYVRAAAEQSESALALANRRYETGLEELINVLESQRRSLSDATQLISVRQARLNNRVDLFLALGGGTEREGSLREER